MTAQLAIKPAPIRKRLEIKASPERAFEVFTGAMGQWWPASHSVLGAPRKTVVIEPQVGGRWYEIAEDGSTCDWGDVAAWEPPHRVLLIWRLNSEFRYDAALTTEVEVRFEPGPDGVTVMEFEHRGLENFGPGSDKLLEGMNQGWGEILEGFAETAAA